MRSEGTTGKTALSSDEQNAHMRPRSDPPARFEDSTIKVSVAETMAANRARVLAGVPAPFVTFPPLTAAAAQRAAVERAGELTRLLTKMDLEISTVDADLAEARHRLRDAKMAVLPAFDVKYEVDENARVPLAQIVLMAAISCLVLKLLV
jgi:hypothetical protein